MRVHAHGAAHSLAHHASGAHGPNLTHLLLLLRKDSLVHLVHHSWNHWSWIHRYRIHRYWIHGNWVHWSHSWIHSLILRHTLIERSCFCNKIKLFENNSTKPTFKVVDIDPSLIQIELKIEKLFFFLTLIGDLVAAHDSPHPSWNRIRLMRRTLVWNGKIHLKQSFYVLF